MSDKERLERIKQYYSCMNVLEPDLQEDIKWLIKRVEELELEVNDWRDEAIKWNKRFEESEESHLETKELLKSIVNQNKCYREVLKNIYELAEYDELYSDTTNLYYVRENDYMNSYLFESIVSKFIRLVEILGFNWEQVEQAYIEKNKVNHERQERGY